MNRRRAFQLTAASLALPFGATRAEQARAPRIRLAVSTYSYWHFKGERYPIEKVIEHAAALGFDGVEILHRQMTDESPGYVNALKQAAFRNGLDLVMLSIHQNFVSPDAGERNKEVEHTKRCIELAAQPTAANPLAAALRLCCNRLNP